MLVSYTFEGGAYQHDLLVEMIEDLGGWIVNKRVIAQELTMTFTVPDLDSSIIMDITRKIAGKIKTAPLLGTEIAVIAPTKPICMVEFQRRKFSKSDRTVDPFPSNHFCARRIFTKANFAIAFELQSRWSFGWTVGVEFIAQNMQFHDIHRKCETGECPPTHQEGNQEFIPLLPKEFLK